MVLHGVHLQRQADASHADKCREEKRKSARLRIHKYKI